MEWELEDWPQSGYTVEWQETTCGSNGTMSAVTKNCPMEPLASSHKPDFMHGSHQTFLAGQIIMPKFDLVAPACIRNNRTGPLVCQAVYKKPEQKDHN